MAKVDLNIVFTGIVSYAPTSGGPCKCADEVRFVMPNIRNWQQSKNDCAILIPPHHPFLIARKDEVALDCGGFWKGAQPSGVLYDKWVYWMLKNENIRVDRMEKKGVKFGKTANVVRLSELCPEAGLSNECLREDTPRVAARVVLTDGRLSQRSLTTERYEFERCGGKKTAAQELADEVQVSVKALKLSADNELVLKRLGLNDGKKALTPIILRRRYRPLMTIYFGSAPEADLGAVVGRTTNHDHGGTNYHFELHYEMSSRRPFAPLPVPTRVPAGPGTPPLGGGDRCPPSSGG